MVTGLSESDARDALQAAGFLASKADVDVPFGSDQAGKVVSQSPTAGTPAAKGSTVSITVGRSSRRRPPPRPPRPPPPPALAITTTTTCPPALASTPRRGPSSAAAARAADLARKLRSRSWPRR